MANDYPRDRPHLLLRNNGVREPYRQPNQVITRPARPGRERAAHAKAATSSPNCAGRRIRPPFFMGLGGAEQRAWSEELLARVASPGEANVSVCLLDSGMRRTDPLIESFLAAADWQTINPAWGADDTPAWQGHGTRMAGVSLYGDQRPITRSR